jgi:hypothetical protein
MGDTAHFVVQGKGGAGKTFVSWLLAQHRQEKGKLQGTFDIDQQNPMLSAYKALNATQIDLKAKEDSAAIERAKFDTLMRSILTSKGEVVIDTGAKEYASLVGYMESNGIVEILSDAGKEVAVHIVVAGSDMLASCLAGLELVVQCLSKTPAKFYVWLNEHHGDLNFGDNKTFEETNFYKEKKTRLAGIVTLGRQPSEFAKKLVELREARLTFNEGHKSEKFDVIERSRIHRMKQAMFSQLDMLFADAPSVTTAKAANE